MTKKLEERVALAMADMVGTLDKFCPDEDWFYVAREIIAMCREVKPLGWPKECRKGQRVFGEGGLTRYAIVHYGEPYIYRWAAGASSWSEPFDTYEAAKASAEAHHAERVRGMLK